MSLALKPLNYTPPNLDSKEKRYIAAIEKALTSFDTIEEWADYISSLAKLSKALSGMDTWIPKPYQVAHKLAQCLSPSLPSGVHMKCLEVYKFIFDKLGPLLAKEVNIWVPGLLGLMSHASISVKPQLLGIYAVLLELDSQTLKIICKPLLASLLPAIDDESNGYFAQSFAMLELLQQNLQNDVLFWQNLFLVLMTDSEKRLGGLIWLTKKLPPLVEWTPQAEAVVTPEPGLLIRALVSCLEEENLLVQRGSFDLLLAQLPLESPLLAKSQPRDITWLVISACRTVLRRDMSLNRRLWSFLLGPQSQQAYFDQYALSHVTSGLLEMVATKPTDACRIALAMMDKWEIGNTVLPVLFVPLFQSIKDDTWRTLFDTVESHTIWSQCYKMDSDFIINILKTFTMDEEMLCTHLPLILLSALANEQLDLALVLVDMIPERAFEFAPATQASSSEIIGKIDLFYATQERSLSVQEVTFHCVALAYDILMQNTQFIKATTIFTTLMGKVNPVWDNSALIETLTKREFASDETQSLVLCFEYLSPSLDSISNVRLLKRVVGHMWNNLDKSEHSLKKLSQSFNIEPLLCDLFKRFPTKKTMAMDFLWTAGDFADPLQLLLDDLSNANSLMYLHACKWVVSTVHNGTCNKLFKFLTERLVNENDLDMFSYYITTLINVLKCDRVVLENFAVELTATESLIPFEDEDISTYKNLTMVVVLKFLSKKPRHVLAVCSCLSVVDILGNDTEHLTLLLISLATEYIPLDEEMISVSIMNLLSKLTHNSSVIEFLTNIVGSITHPLVMASYIKLLSQCIKYVDNPVPLVAAITNKIEALHAENSSDTTLFSGLEELLKNAVYTEQVETKENFLSVMSGVFSGPETHQPHDRLRTVWLQCVKQTFMTCFFIWDQSLHRDKFKFKTKKMMEQLFLMEPLAVIQLLMSFEKPNALKLLHVLERKPALTMPYIYKAAANDEFMNKYISTLEDDTMEEIYPEFIAHVKECKSSSTALKHITIMAEKIGHSKFGESKKIRKELTDAFMRVIPSKLENIDDFMYVIPKLKLFLEQDKASNALSTFAVLIAPALKGDNVSEQVLELAVLLGKEPTNKFKLVVGEIFQDSLFQLPAEQVGRWSEIFQSIATSKINDLTQTSVFNWNSNVSNLLKRLTYLVLICDEDSQILSLPVILDKISEAEKGKDTRPVAMMALRAIVMKFSATHLTDQWTSITCTLQRTLQEFLENQSMDPTLVLQTCKLLDLLLCLNVPDFPQWVFIVDTIAAVYRQTPFIALADELGEALPSAIMEGEVYIDSDIRHLPALFGVRKIDHVRQLRSWFNNISYVNYERVYHMSEIDAQACEEDLLKDLLGESVDE